MTFCGGRATLDILRTPRILHTALTRHTVQGIGGSATVTGGRLPWISVLAPQPLRLPHCQWTGQCLHMHSVKYTSTKMDDGNLETGHLSLCCRIAFTSMSRDIAFSRQCHFKKTLIYMYMCMYT